MGVLKLKSDKKRKEKCKETKIDYAKCIKKTKVKEKIIRKEVENDFDVSIFMKTDHASSKIRQLNYAKLVKGMRKNKNLITNHIEKILEIYGMGIIDEDENVRNYSSKIFYHLINSNIDFDIFHSKVKTCLFHSLKIEKVSLKVLNLELCHIFFFTKIEYCYKFFYEFLNNILSCFVSIPIEQQVRTVKYFFLLFKYKVKYKRWKNEKKHISEKSEMSWIRSKGESNPLESKRGTLRIRYENRDRNNVTVNGDKYSSHHMMKKGERDTVEEDIYMNGTQMRGRSHRIDTNADSGMESEDCYQLITCMNRRNSHCDPFLLKKDIKVSIKMVTKMGIYTKLLKCFHNFMDEVTYNSINVDLIHLYTKILKIIILIIKKKKKQIFKEEMMILIKKFIKKAIEVINENIVNLSNSNKGVKNMIYYFIVLITTLCIKTMDHLEDVNKNIYMNPFCLVKYCLSIYFYVFIDSEFFPIIITNRMYGKSGLDEVTYTTDEGKNQQRFIDVPNGDLKENDSSSFTEYCAYSKKNSNNDGSIDGRDKFCNENRKKEPSRNSEKYSKKYFHLLIYFYEIFMHRKDEKILLRYGTSCEQKIERKKNNNDYDDGNIISSNISSSNSGSGGSNDNHVNKIIVLIEKKINSYVNCTDVNTVCGFILSYLKSFSETSIDKISHFCYFIIILAQQANALGKFEGGKFFTFNQKSTEWHKSQCMNIKDMGIGGRTNGKLSFQFLSSPFMFMFLVDCQFFLNNKFFETFYECFNEDQKNKIMEVIFFVQNEDYTINIITKEVFDKFLRNIYFFLYNYDNSIFVKNCLFFFSFLSVNKHKMKKVCGDFENFKGNKQDLERLFHLDVRNSLHEVVKEKREKLINYFLCRNREIIISFDLIANLYFVCENTNKKLLLFIYLLIVKFEIVRSKMNSSLVKEEAMILLNRVSRIPISDLSMCQEMEEKTDYFSSVDMLSKPGCQSGVQEGTHMGWKKEKGDILLFQKKFRFIICQEYLFREDFLLFFLKLNLSETYFVFRNDIYTLIESECLRGSINRIDLEHLDEIKYANIILIIKRMSYIISNVKVQIDNNSKNINNSVVITDYLFSVIDRVGLTDSTLEVGKNICERLFILVKIIFLFYFVSFNLFPSLETNWRLVNSGLNDDRRKVADGMVKAGKKDELDILTSVDMRTEHIYYYKTEDVIIDVELFVKYLKEVFSQNEYTQIEHKMNMFVYVMPHFSITRRLFNFMFEQDIMYISNVNKDLEYFACTRQGYDLNTHVTFQELLNKFESCMNVFSFKKLLDLPVREVIKLLTITIFKMSINRNILHVHLLNNFKNLPNEYFYDLNFFLFFYHFLSFLIQKMRSLAECSFSQRTYYSISFIIDTLLCSYCIKENVEKTTNMESYRISKGLSSDSEENDSRDKPDEEPYNRSEEMTSETILTVIKGKIEKLNDLLRHVVNEISEKEKKYVFPKVQLLIEYYF
ncbi:hypothetical protein, conserved [Plasmodium gonderi]|uniref:Uncharacterized protein n=1 Tax=Plasmodium gonderi TaxID=77519 RepID=A0A1Y1JAV7_PLAGO|nr:hypothetical protein, conserved [Plasmodium gonderi]GAW79390.1 hypothetical protein, conserved [Plasmodium gonderi]